MPHVKDCSAHPYPDTERRSGPLLHGARRLLRPLVKIADAAEAMLDGVRHWQTVSRDIRRLSLLDDATLAAMALRRDEIVHKVFDDAQARRRPRRRR